jgi:hypothetical protein
MFSKEWEPTHWQYLPKEMDEEEVIENYLVHLNAEDDREKIEDIISNLHELLK